MHPKLLYHQGRITKAVELAKGKCLNGICDKKVIKLHVDRLKEVREKVETDMNSLHLDESELDFIAMLMDEIDEMELELTTTNLLLENQDSTLQTKSKLPKVNFREFDETNPDVWFMQLENQFFAHGIASETDKFVLLEGFLNTYQALIIQKISANCVIEIQPYQVAKKLLLDAFSLTLDERLERAINLTLAEGERPSQFLARFRLLFRDTSFDQFFQWIVRRRLPRDVMMTLMNKSVDTVDDFVKSADVLVQARPEVMTNATNTKTFNPKSQKLCSYHSKFGAKSTKCDSSPTNRCSMYYLVAKPKGSVNSIDEQ